MVGWEPRRARGERSDSEVPLPWIVSEAVGVDGVSAEVHQLVDPLSKLLVDGVSAGLDALKAADRLLGAVGHVNDKLVIGDEGEAVVHDLVGLWRSVLHVFKIIDRGLVANPLKLKRI